MAGQNGIDSAFIPPARWTAPGLWAALRAAVVTMAACLATLACVLALSPTPDVAVLGVVLALSLSRSHMEGRAHGGRAAMVALPLIALGALGAGLLLQRVPWLGAALFVAALSLPIWVRRFGPRAARLGSLVGLPFIALLVTPRATAHSTGPVPPLALPVVVGLLALFWVVQLHALARRAGWLPPPPAGVPVRAERRAPTVAGPGGGPLTAAGMGRTLPGTAPEGGLAIAPSTRMALQMAVALGVSFTVGYLVFPGHWAWIVLTAYIVTSGNRGRLDVAYKSVLRVGGALAGTVLALAVQRHAPHGGVALGAIFAALFLGCWLRHFGYGWWALFVTVAFALLQGLAGGSGELLLWPRMEEIVFGAVLAVAAAWLVLPVHSTLVLRRRLADALAALSDTLDPAAPDRSPAGFLAALRDLEDLLPAFRASRLLSRRGAAALEPADLLLDCRMHACALAASGAPPEVRRAVGAARKALREPAQLAPALRHLRDLLAAR